MSSTALAEAELADELELADDVELLELEESLEPGGGPGGGAKDELALDVEDVEDKA